MAKHLARDLDKLSRDILTLGGRVEEAIGLAITALRNDDNALARTVIEGDQVIDRCEIRVEEDCLKLLALHQPVAADLRFVVTALKVNNDLERMGDLAANIAICALHLSGQKPLAVLQTLDEMATRVRRMSSLSLDALVGKDSDLARAVCALDDEVDRMHEKMFGLVQEQMREAPDTIPQAVTALSVSRNLERIADLATNIAQDLIFMVDGEVVRHAGLET